MLQLKGSEVMLSECGDLSETTAADPYFLFSPKLTHRTEEDMKKRTERGPACVLLPHPLAGDPQSDGVVKAVAAVVLHQVDQRCEAAVQLHVEIVLTCLVDLKVFHLVE